MDLETVQAPSSTACAFFPMGKGEAAVGLSLVCQAALVLARFAILRR